MSPLTLFSLNTDGGTEGRELPNATAEWVLALGSVPTGGRRLGSEKEDVGG